MMASSREYIEIKTLGSNASQRLSLSDCSFMFNVILPPPPKNKQPFTKALRRVEAATLHGDVCHVVCLLCYVQSQVISNL